MSFNFGNTGGTGDKPATVFGTQIPQFGANSNTNPAAFGQSSTPASSAPTSTAFGGATTASSTTAPAGLFALSSTPTPSIFGNLGSNPASGTSTPFGAASNTVNTQGGSMFGNLANSSTPASTSGGGLFSNLAPPTTPSFGSFGGQQNGSGISTPNSENKPPAATSGLGAAQKPQATSNLFGGSNTPTASSAPAGLSTPATTRPPSSFTNSTTPAGPPPTDAAKSNPTSNLFGSTGQPLGSLFGSKPPASTPTTSGGIFFGTSTTPSVLGGADPAPSGGLFPNLRTPAPTTSGATTPAASGSTTEAPKTAFSFPSATLATATTGTQASSTPAIAASSLFGNTTTSQVAPTSSAPAQTSNLFGSLSNTVTSSAPTPAPATTSNLFGSLKNTSSAPTTTSTPAPSISFSGLGGKPLSTNPPTTTSGVASTSTAAPASSGVTGQPGNPAVQPSTGPTNGNQQSQGAPAMGASTTGPVPQLSRLKNKTMDEIITRWASDLSKYQKEFQEQAAKVASWDRLLVDNGEKIQKLFQSTFEAQRASAEVERQLANVESQQDELTSWLDRYEADVDELFSRQVGHGETLQGPDQERERTYKMAEKVSDRLDEMGKELTTMIDAMNEATATLSKTSKSDDPLSHIVRVLNSHLSQLQWIDQNAALLQKKVTSAQKFGQSIASNGAGGQENDAAESFYRSYMGGRR
ncbi:hypothetical protein B7494_g8450 [Chlorociboria aeruginascens]|nr:hypothetical protein B7494_g8450 [Chlorociboria aeruginascens]